MRVPRAFYPSWKTAGRPALRTTSCSRSVLPISTSTKSTLWTVLRVKGLRCCAPVRTGHVTARRKRTQILFKVKFIGLRCVRTKRTLPLFLSSCYRCYRFTLAFGKKKKSRVSSKQHAVTDNDVVGGTTMVKVLLRRHWLHNNIPE